MTDFSHLHALEERAVRIRERMSAVRNNATQWKAQATQLFQTEQEIADEREFLGLEDMDVDKLYAALFEEQESEVVNGIIRTTNAAEQAAVIRSAAEALVEASEIGTLTNPVFLAKLADLKAALSRGWLARKEANPNCLHLHTKRLVLPANKRKQFDEPFAYHCTDCNRTFGQELSDICNRLSGRVSGPPSEPVRLSSWENCPLCDSTFIEVHEDPIYKPEVVCTNCGLTLQGETVFSIKERWNKR